MPRKGLGKGLDSLIPDFYDEDFDSNSTQSLEDMLNEKEEQDTPKEEESGEDKNIFEELEDDSDVEEDDSTTDGEEEIPEEEKPEETQEEAETSEDLPSDMGSEEPVQTSQEIQVNQAHVDEVKEIVDKNPRITLWSARSSAVFRYLRKTEPEFSISKEASTLIDEAVSKKYPEIWKLFDEY
jgi:hypothetical protein